MVKNVFRLLENISKKQSLSIQNFLITRVNLLTLTIFNFAQLNILSNSLTFCIITKIHKWKNIKNRILRHGGFEKVCLYKQIETNDSYAMKQISIEGMKEEDIQLLKKEAVLLKKNSINWRRWLFKNFISKGLWKYLCRDYSLFITGSP